MLLKDQLPKRKSKIIFFQRLSIKLKNIRFTWIVIRISILIHTIITCTTKTTITSSTDAKYIKYKKLNSRLVLQPI